MCVHLEVVLIYFSSHFTVEILGLCLLWPFDGIEIYGDGLPYGCSLRVIA